MCAHRLWPTVQALGRGLINNRTEIIQHGVRAYNVQNFSNPNLVSQGYQQRNALLGYDERTWTRCVTQSTRETNNRVYCSLHSTVSLRREFPAEEREQYYAILRSLPAYSATIAKNAPTNASCQSTMYSSELDQSKHRSQEMANAFVAVSRLQQNQSLKDSDPSRECNALTANLHHMNDCELLEILKSLALSSGSGSKFVLWNSLDAVCTHRINRWDVPKMLLVADHWYAVGLFRITMYNKRFMEILGKRVASMEPTQLVQFMFYAHFNREIRPFVVKTELEKRLSEVLKYLSIEELGIIAMGCFKTKTFLMDTELLDAIVVKTMANIELVSSVSLGSILKILRKSGNVRWWGLYNLATSLESQLYRLNVFCLVQILLLGSNVVYFHPEVINKISNILMEEINFLRLKDLERVTFALSQCNYIPPNHPDMLQIIGQNLRREDRITEIRDHPRSFTSCVFYLVSLGYYPYDLISAALEPSIIWSVEKDVNVFEMRDISELSWLLEIEEPAGYKGQKLNPDKRAEITSKFQRRIPCRLMKNLTNYESLILEVRDKVGAMLGGMDFIKILYILPYAHTPELVFCTSSEGYPIEIPLDYLNLSPVALKRPLYSEKAVHWNAIIVCSRNSYFKNRRYLQGKEKRKIQQIRKLGYHVCLVPYKALGGNSQQRNIDTLRKILSQESTLKTDTLDDILLTSQEYE